MATLQITSMFALWNMILGLLGGGIVGLYFLGMFSRRANTAGAIVGAVASVGWSLWLKSTDAHFMIYLPSSGLVCMAVGYLASLVLPGRPRDLTGLTVFTPARATPTLD
jgi:Na+/proline symporter